MPPKRAADNEADDARKRQRQAAVRSRIQTLDGPGAVQLLEDLSRRWNLHAPAATTFEQVVSRAFENFGAGMSADLNLDQLGSFGLRQLDDRIHEHEMEAIALYHKLRELKLLGPADADPPGGAPDAPDAPDAAAGDGGENLNRIVKILELVFHAKRTVLSVFQAKLAMHQVHCPDLALDEALDKLLASWQLRFRWMSGETKPNQDLLLYLLDCAMEKRYRRFNGYCFEPIVYGGHNTHAWRQVCSVQDFVYGMISKETNWQQWVNATTNAKTISASVEYLSSCRDYQFPALVKQRGVYAFRNGVYLAREDRFVPFGGDEGEVLPESVVACKFFDAELDPFEGESWRDIPTPYLQSILDYQDFSSDVSRWLYVLIGRLLYPLGDLDAWQVIPFLKGAASSEFPARTARAHRPRAPP